MGDQDVISRANLEGCWRLNEGGGATAYDTSGQGRHLTTLQNVQWADGAAGKCLSFPDRTVVRAAYGAAIDARAWTAFSISFWANSLTTDGSRLISFSSDTVDGLQIQRSGASQNMVLRFSRAGNTESATILNAYDATIRNYVVTFVLATKAWILYRGGVSFANGTLTNTPVMPNRAFVIGNYNTPTTGNGHTGLIDEVRLYKNRVLTPAEVMKLKLNPGQSYQLIADGIQAGLPTLGAPALAQIHQLVAAGIIAGPATLGMPAFLVAGRMRMTADGSAPALIASGRASRITADGSAPALIASGGGGG